MSPKGIVSGLRIMAMIVLALTIVAIVLSGQTVWVVGGLVIAGVLFGIAGLLSFLSAKT